MLLIMQMFVSGYSVSLLLSQPTRHKPILPKTIAPGAGITGRDSTRTASFELTAFSKSHS